MSERIPRVSLALPVYNGENYLAATLDSLLAQTYGDFELVVSDNASTDGTESICRTYAARDDRIRYIRHAENQGMVWNFNEAFRATRGEFFKWAAHDDPCEPTFLEKAVDVLDREPSAILCCSEVAKIDDKGNRISAAFSKPPGRLSFDASRPHQRYADVLFHCTYTTEVYGLIRRDVLETTKLFRPYCLGEKVLTAELALRGSFYRIPEVLMYWRSHQEQLTSEASFNARRLVANPRASNKIVWPFRVESTLGYLCMIGRARIGLGERLLCLWALTRYLLQIKKWLRVSRELIEDTAIWRLVAGGSPSKCDGRTGENM